MNCVVSARWLSVAMLVAIALSFGMHLGHRDQHFQEIDSDGVYVWGRDFANWPRIYTNDWLKKSSPRNNIEQRLHWIDSVAEWQLPYALRCGFCLGWGTTYAPGQGIAYGLITTPDDDLSTFMHRTLTLTLLLFHLSAWLLYRASCRVSASPFVSAGITLIYLFSISHYSYGYHLGSSVWVLATSMLWIDRVMAQPVERRPQVMARWTALLVWFNYLIALYWVAGGLVALFRAVRVRDRFRSVIRLVCSQSPALMSVGCVSYFFGQAGQGYRGSFETMPEAMRNGYYYLVNTFAWTTYSITYDRAAAFLGITLLSGVILALIACTFARWQRGVITLLVLTLGLIASAWGMHVLTRPTPPPFGVTWHEAPVKFVQSMTWLLLCGAVMGTIAIACLRRFRLAEYWVDPCQFAPFVVSMLTLVTLLVAVRMLGFIPTRHWFFLSPVLFVASTWGLQPVVRWCDSRVALALLAGILILGFLSVQHRQDETRRLAIPEEMFEGVQSFVEVGSISVDREEPIADELLSYDTALTLLDELRRRGLVQVKSRRVWEARGEKRALMICQHPAAKDHLPHEPTWAMLDPRCSRMIRVVHRDEGVWFTTRNPDGALFSRPNSVYAWLIENPRTP